MNAEVIYLPCAGRFHAWLPICGRPTKKKTRCLARVREADAGSPCHHHAGREPIKEGNHAH